MGSNVLLESKHGVDVADVIARLDARGLFTELQALFGEVSPKAYIGRLIDMFSITFETARGVLYRLLEEHVLSMTSRYTLQLA